MNVAQISWLALAAVHLPPAAVAVRPSLVTRLYGVETGGDIGILLIHRGVLFAAVAALCVLALLDASARRAASLTVGVSVVGFLLVYLAAGAPGGPLRLIAVVDLLAAVPLVAVLRDAWR